MDYQRNSTDEVVVPIPANDAGDTLGHRRIKLDKDSATKTGWDSFLFTSEFAGVTAVEVVFDCVGRYRPDLPSQKQC
ncbi:MAG TPA: hypothetical protein VGV15_04065 [Terriglobales bacterium]|nr:hypothetical protein [Terriglobales bacterium]